MSADYIYIKQGLGNVTSITQNIFWKDLSDLDKMIAVCLDCSRHCRYGRNERRGLKPSAIQLFVQQHFHVNNNEKIKAAHYWFSVGDPPVTDDYPHKGPMINTESVSM